MMVLLAVTMDAAALKSCMHFFPLSRASQEQVQVVECIHACEVLQLVWVVFSNA